MVYDPVFERKNLRDNIPPIIHSPKGAGSENTSRLAMIKPADGWKGVKSFVSETVKLAGPNACLPFTVGVGIGGNFESDGREKPRPCGKKDRSGINITR